MFFIKYINILFKLLKYDELFTYLFINIDSIWTVRIIFNVNKKFFFQCYVHNNYKNIISRTLYYQ